MGNEFEFPLYMGFGKLRASSFIKENELESAEYCFTDKAVHRLTHDIINDRWSIEDIFDNTGSITTAKDLKEGVMRHFNFLTPKTSSLFNYFRDQICKIGNIYFQDLSAMQDEGGVASYYPSGRLVILRLPIFFDETGDANANKLFNEIPYIETEKRLLLKLCEVYDSSIVLTKATGEVTVIPVLMFEYVITLASVLDVLNWMVNKNIIVKDKKFRMIIQDSNKKNQHSILTTAGTSNDDYLIHTILFKGLDESKITFEDFQSKIVETL